MGTVTDRSARGYRTLRLPISEADYERFMSEKVYAKGRLDELYERYPELVPGRLDGDKIYSATTAGKGSISGASVTDSAAQATLTHAYGVFAEEARALDPAYTPETVNTDGWLATQGAWKALFPTITVILCFLHAFLKIRDRATKALTEVFEQVRENVWHAYRAPTKAAFAQRLRRLREL